MDWTLSEYLNLIELRSQTWCVAQIGAAGGFRIPHSEGVLFYAAIGGSVRLSWGVGEGTVVEQGDIAIILSGDAHAVRRGTPAELNVLPFLAEGRCADAPLSFAIGDGPAEAQLLCGRLKARWPGAKRPGGLPAVLLTNARDAGVDVAQLLQRSAGAGGTSMLTRMATLIFTNAFREHPASETIFRNSGLHEPVARAVQFIETHPFTEWTVARLANKVGMGRSNFALRFTADLGRTPMTFVTEQRMKHAALFLERTELKVAEIAERIGYRSESAFSHRFFAHFKMTPGQLRSRRQADRLRAQDADRDERRTALVTH